jgi:hypothetical protein
MSEATKGAIISALNTEFQKPEYQAKTYDLVKEARAAGADTTDSKESLLMTKVMVNNPDSAPQVPDETKLNLLNLMGKLDNTELANIPEDSLDRVKTQVQNKDTTSIGMSLTVWVAKGYITQTKKDALMADVSAVVNDPNHPAQVPGTSPWDDLIATNAWTYFVSQPKTGTGIKQDIRSLPTQWIKDAI